MNLETSGIQRAVDAAGSQAALANQLEVSQQFIHKSVRKGYLPLDRAQAVSAIYGIDLADLVRPDIANAMRSAR